MSIGTYISGGGHVALVVWMVAGWGMQSDPLPFEVTDVALISGADFAAISQSAQNSPTPDISAEGPAITQPEAQPSVPEPAPVPQNPVPQNNETPTPPEAPAPIEPPAAEARPEAPELIVPNSDVTDTAPVLPEAPQIVTQAPSAELGTSLRPVPRPAPRVAPEIVTPTPDRPVDPQVSEAAEPMPEAEPDQPLDESTQAAAPEAASTEIVTEAEKPEFAPEISRRPQSRPHRPAPQLERENIDPIAAAVAEAAAGGVPASETQPSTPSAPQPGLAGGQLPEAARAGFLRQVGNCWNTGTLSTGAQSTVIVMAFEMTPDGRPVANSIRLESYSGGSAADAQAAFGAARRALIRCTGDRGYGLPPEQYEMWRQVELVVDPTHMRQR